MLELEEKLKGFANVEQEFRVQHEIKDKCGQDHRLYLQANHWPQRSIRSRRA